uniref:Solute carrier family 22 member 6 n=1 Tax=Scleropages formosus TaxID=113540 RepID=A0A8C9V0U1_SCLFO
VCAGDPKTDVKMKFDSLLDEVNGLGKFQILIVILLVVPRFILPCHFLLNNFIAAMPSHHCNITALVDGDIFENLTQEQRLTVSIPAQEDGTLSSCEMFPQPQLHLLYGPSNTTDTPAVECQNGWVYDTSTFTSTIATEWDLVCNKKGMNKATATVFFCGVMLGAVIFGTLCDRFGRKSMLLLSYVCAMGFGLTSAFSSSYTMFAVMRFFTGLGLTGISIISIVLSIEWVDVQHRTLIGVIGSMAWTVGNMLLAGLAYAVNDWRSLLITVTAPLGFAIITWWWIPESARWLIANGKVEKAHFYLQKCAKCNRNKIFTCSCLCFPQMLSSIVMVEKQNKSYTYVDLVRTPKMRKLAILSGMVWYGVASTYYGISLNISGFGLNIYLTHFIYAAIEFPAKLMVYFFLDKIGRRHCQAGTLLLTGTCIAINIFLSKDMWLFRTIVAIVGKGLSEASFTTVFLYTTELYPTVVRQNGMGYNSFMGRLGASITPLVLLLEDVWKLLPQVIICALAMLSGLVALLLPETHNIRLPETIEDIEKPGKFEMKI